MSEQEIRAAIVAERRAQLELYASLSEEQWDVSSLCSGWRVREVLAHTTMPFRYSAPRVAWEMVKARGSAERMADRRARIDAGQLSAGQLWESLRDDVEHPWVPPGGGLLGALSHDVIHGLDVAVPLGLDHLVAPERVAMVLGGLEGEQRALGVDLDGVRLQADDVDWTWGTGEPVRGRAQDLLLLVCARRVPGGRLHGPAPARLSPAV
ncbi:maleylpyruvate isomerase family mycothiol-dependent enzyme [Blastococcus haudaquaticus]|uniref:TIGR03083 family protein n=1 Tax=Blastococcus haudaquaticus TaxID=1938745 RepID=A0A286H0K2_9ACTN|nr:maleylpyruvate isomerase family mycothiol-dependent enzyme [Blastococcus haudaquaticus]SOE01287.1 TIGR03083 family protein [Blastococcus haudaquaticus]